VGRFGAVITVDAAADHRALRRLGGLVLALGVAGIAWLAVGVTHALQHAHDRHEAQQATTSMAGLRVPAGFVRVTSGCRSYRCYLVSRPVQQVGPDVPAIIASTGARPTGNPDTCGITSIAAQSQLASCDTQALLDGRSVVVLVIAELRRTATGPPLPTGRTDVEVDFSPSR
jgi:hypothetical protein